MTNSPHLAVQYELCSSLPEDLISGEALLLEVRVTNRGTQPLASDRLHPLGLSYHLRESNGRAAVYDGLRTPLPAVLAPNQTVELELRVDAPSLPGDYVLEIDIVEEGISWFSTRGIPPLAQTIHYTAQTRPRACIINGNWVANDALGNTVTAQLRALRNAGYHTLVLTEFIHDLLPVELRRFGISLRLQDLQQPDQRTRQAAEHFFSSDILIINYSTYYELAQALKLVRGGAVIFDYHGITPPELWQGDQQGLRDLVLGREHLTLVQFADYAIAHSQFTRQELIATGLIAPERVRVIPLAAVADVPGYGVPDAAVIERYGLAGKHVLLYVGRMARNKRLTDLVEALALVRERHPNTVLMLVGDNRLGPYRDYTDEVQRLAEARGCGDALIWTGQVPDLEPYYRSCTLFVTASIHEGFCSPVVEAMAHAKPVVAANATALPETVGAGGLLFEPQNPVDMAAKITRLLDDLPATQPGPAPVAGLSPEPLSEAARTRLHRGTIGFVGPRYGLEILGGAERMLRGWAEHLAGHGYHTEVFTTCTADMSDWSNHFEPGVEQINGITVHRFPTDRVDAGVFHQVLGKANRGEHVSYDEEQAFVRNNLQSSALNDYLREHADEFVCVVFGPYLFGTSYWGMQALPDKAIMLPCLHDEASARLSVFRDMLEGSAGLFFNAYPERTLAIEELHVANPQRLVVGYGFDTDGIQGDAAAFRARHNLPEQILLYAGRLEQGKNVPLLFEYFVRYKTEHPGPLTLVLAGTGDVPVPQRPDIVALGFQSDELPHAYAAASVFCMPSVNESFSIVIMESWLQSRPVLVHADCAVTSDHVVRSDGGYIFGDYVTFADALQQVLNDPDDAEQRGRRGRDYVEQQYSWDVVTDRFVQGIADFTAPRSEYARLAQRAVQRALSFTYTRIDDTLLSLVHQAQAELGTRPSFAQHQQLLLMTKVGQPDYVVSSQLPIFGRLISWLRKHLTSHLREPYLDPIVQRQEMFNSSLVETLLPMLEQSLHEQRRLRREVAVLQHQLTTRHEENDPIKIVEKS